MGCGSSAAVPEEEVLKVDETKPEPKKEKTKKEEAKANPDKKDAKPKANVKEFKISRSFKFSHPVNALWKIAGDWKLKYLESYANVKVETKKTDKEQLRTVEIPGLPTADGSGIAVGKITERLLSIDEQKKEFSYIMTASPLPYKDCKITARVRQGEGAGTSIMEWETVALSIIDDTKKAKKIAEDGLQRSINIVLARLETEAEEEFPTSS